MSKSKTGLRDQLDSNLSYLTVLVPATAALMAASDRTTRRLRAGGRDTGASAVEWVVITALIVTAVLAVGLILTNKFKGKANDLDLTTP